VTWTAPRAVEISEGLCREIRQGPSLAAAGQIAYRAYALGSQLGESPVWSSRDGAVYSVDIPNSTLHRLYPETAICQSLNLPGPSSAVALSSTGALLVAMGNKLMELDPASGALRQFLDLAECGVRDCVFNDMKCDRLGRLWIGTRHRDRLPGLGALYRVRPEGTLANVDGGYTVANGIACSPDGAVLYVADSRQNIVFRYSVDPASGDILHKERFSTFADAPDGMTVDAEGFLWVAQWGGAAVRRVAPEGTCDRIVELPAAFPTSCVFGGANLATLYVTTAREPSRPLSRPADLGGALFALGVGASGIEEVPVADTRSISVRM